MSDSVSRRSFVQSGLLFLVAGRATLASELGNGSAQRHEVGVTLEGRAAELGQETVNFGLPLPPGFLSNPRRVYVATSAGEEISAAVRTLEPWRIGGRDGAIRSLLIQFQFDFSRERTQRIKIVFQQPRRKNVSSLSCCVICR